MRDSCTWTSSTKRDIVRRIRRHGGGEATEIQAQSPNRAFIQTHIRRPGGGEATDMQTQRPNRAFIEPYQGLNRALIEPEQSPNRAFMEPQQRHNGASIQASCSLHRASIQFSQSLSRAYGHCTHPHFNTRTHVHTAISHLKRLISKKFLLKQNHFLFVFEKKSF